MANKKLIKKFLTIGVTTSPLLLFLPSALIRVDNKEVETGDYDQINIFSTTTRNANTAVEKYETGSWNKEVWGKVDRTWFPKNDDPLKPETIMEIYENGRWVELQNSAGQKTIWNPSDDSANALNPNFVKKIRLRYLSMRAYQDQDSMLIPENYFSGGFWFSKDIVLASNIDVKIYDARKSKYKTSPKLERHETVTIDPFSFSYTSRTTVSPTVISNTTTTDGTSEESVSKQFSSRYNAFYTENPLTGVKNTSWSDNSDWGTTDIVHDIFSFNGAAFLNKYALYKPDNGLYNDAASFAKSDGWITIRNSLGGYFYFASGRGTQARPQEVVLEFDVRFNINSDGTTTNDFNSTTRSFFGTTQAYRYDNQSLLQKFSMQKPSFWRNTNLIIKEEYDDRVKKSFNTLDLNTPQAEFYLVNTQLNSSKNLNDSNSVVKINRNNISNYSDFSKPFTNKAVIQESIDIDNVDSASTTPSTWQASNIELVIKQDEKSKKYWKFANNNGRFTLSDRNNFSSEANINSNIVWSLTDYGTVIATIKESKWLTNLQKAQLMADLEKQIDQDYNLPGGTGKRNLNEWIAYVKAYDDLQKQIEEKFFETVNYASSDEKVTVDDYDGTKKLDYLFSTPAYKNNIDSRKFSYWQYAAYKSNEFNQSEKLFDRSNAPTTVSYNNLQSTLAIWKGANFGTPNGLKNLKALEDKINNYAVIADSEYNKQQIKTFIEKIKNKALNDFVNIQVKNDQGQSSTTLANAWKANWKYDYLGDIQKLEKAVSLANDIYTKTKTFNQELDTIKTSDLFTGGSTLTDKNPTNDSFVWYGETAREQFTNVNEPAWTKLMNQLIGSDQENNKANNVFASETNLLNTNLKQNYLTGFNNLVSSLDNIFGNGGKLAEEFKQYKYIDAKKYYDIDNEISNLTDWFGKVSKIKVGGTEYGNRHNFATNSTQDFVLLKPYQDDINDYLLQISNTVYKESANVVKTQINALQNLSDAKKQSFKAEIDKFIDTNLATNKLNVVYKNDSDFTKTLELAKEQDRINGIAKSLAATENKFDYDQANNQTKSNTLVKDAQLAKFYLVESLTDATVEIKSIAETEQLTDSGRVKLTYVVKSTKNLYSTTIQSDETTSNWITGFAADRVQEKQRIDALSATFALKTPKSVLAREITKENFAQYINVNGIDDQTEEIVLKDKSFVVDDKTGTLTFDYVIRSKRINDLETGQRKATVNNFKTEVDRLNDVVANIKNNTLTVTNNSINDQANRLPSEVQNNEITFADINNQNAKVKIIDIIKNDDNGTLTINYALTSTVEDLKDVQSTEKNSLTVNGFLTTLEKKRREVLQLINDSNNLTKKEKTEFRNKANESTQTVQSLNELATKVKIHDLSNTVKTAYTNLNNNQVADIVDKMREETVFDDAQLLFNDASELNDAMSDLHDKVLEQLKVLTNNQNLTNDQDNSAKTAINYTLADANKNGNYNSDLLRAQNVLNKTSGENEDLATINTIVQNLTNTYNELNGQNNLDTQNAEINKLNKLSQEQKNAIKTQMANSANLTDLKDIVDKAQTLDGKIAALEAKIAEAETKKTDGIYTKDTKDKQADFDQAITNAETALNGYKTKNLTNLGASELNAQSVAIVSDIATLDSEINKLDGYKNELKESLKNWELLTETQIKELQAKVDSISEKQPSEESKERILNEGLSLSKQKAKNDLIVDNYPNLSTAELTKLKEAVDSAQLDKTADHKYDSAVKAVLDNAKTQNDTKQNAINAINGLSDLTQNQKTVFENQVKSSPTSQSSTVQENATVLNTAISEAKNVVKEQIQKLAKDDQLTYETAKSANKVADKYRLADSSLKATYDAKLEALNNLIVKDNVSKTEIDNAKAELISAYDALNGDEKAKEQKSAIGKLNNLTPKQKEQLKEKIDNASDQETANQIIEKAKQLDQGINDLKTKLAEAKSTKEQPVYLNDTTTNKEALDNQITATEKLLKDLESFNLATNSNDQITAKTTEVKKQKESLNTAITNLDGKREALRNEINAYASELLDNKQDYLDRINQLDKNNWDEEAANAILNDSLNKAKENAQNQIDALTNLTNDEKAAFKQQINDAQKGASNQPDSNISAILNEAKAQNNAKQAAIDHINGLNNLNDDQKAALVEEVKAAASSEVETIKTKANELNTSMKNTKNKVLEELQTLTENSNLELNDAAYSADKTLDNYQFASSDVKVNYDAKLAKIKELLSQNTDKATIDQALKELEKAYNALNGEENKNKKAAEVNKLDNLSKDQKDKIKDLLNNATDEEAAQKILEKAQKLNLDLGDLEKQITSTETKVATSIYTNDAQGRKEAVDQALENAEDKLAELKAKDLSNATADSLNGLANEANQSKEALKTADEALDGNREVLRNDIKNHFPSLNANQKGLLKAEIEKLPKVPTQEETQAIYDKALKYAQTNAKDELAKLDNLTKAEKDTYIAKIDAATLDKTNQDFAINVKNLLDQAKADETAKAKAIETINKLTNLNPAQKSSLTEEVKNNQASETNNIVKKAKAIDDKMKAYKDIAEVDKTSVDYVEADEDRQVKYNNQVAIRTEDLGDNGTNLSVEQIDAKIVELNSAINGLNGDEKVAQAKENAIAKINGENPIYTNLTAQQKAEAIAKINEKDRVADVNSVDANNALVNGTMATLDQYLNNESKIKNDINYTGSEEDLREAYDDAIQALKDYKTALNEPSDDTKDILSNDKIQEKINAVHEAINNLNGKEHIKTVRAEEIAKINALENINDAQKSALIAKVDKATTPEDVRAATEEAAALDEKMVELKQAVADNQDTPNSVDYKNATEVKMREFDKAFNNANNLADKENGSAELSIDNIDSLIEKLNVAAQNLDGDEKINNKKAKVRNLINDLEHLNDAQKTALIEEVDKAKLLANVDKVVDKAQTLNNAMGQLKETAKAINEELTQPDNPKYVAASQEPKANYDEAKAKVDELISNQGSNEDVAKVLELEKALIDAKNALDGDKNFEYAKEKAIEKVNKNNNLTPAEKQALIDQVKDLAIPSNSDNADEVQNFKDNLDKIVNKADLINDVKNNANLTPEQKADLIDDIQKANVDDKLNSEANKNSYGDTLNNIKAKEKAYERINATDDSQLITEDKAKLSDNISQLDPRDKTFADQLANEELKENKIKEIRSNPNLTDDQKSQLIDEVANLDNKQSDLVDQIAKIDQKAKLIEKIQTNEHISDEDKNKLVNEVINEPHDDSKLTDKLNNIESKLNLIDQIKQNANLDENTKEALVDQVHKLAKDSDNFAAEADNISAKVKAIEQIKANDELTKENKANLVEEIINLDNNQTKSSLDYQISNVDKKAELYEQINQSDLPQTQKDALIAELDTINANSENASVSFDNIKDQLNKLSKINNDQTLSDNDKAKLVEDVLANNPTEQNYNEIAENIDKKQEAIDQIRQNPNLTQEQKDSISQNIRELDETSEEFTNKLEMEKARLDLIDQLHQEAKDNKISDETRDKLISETLNLANDSSFINNLNNIKTKDKLIQQVKASDVLNDTSTVTLINNILDNNATSTEFDNKHNQITQLYVDAEELAKAKNDLVDLTKSKKFEKLTKAKQDAINKAIADSDEILNNLNSHNNEDVVKQTTIDKRLKEASPILIWPYIVAVSAVTWLIGMLIFVFGRKKK
ncbi:lipoprotein 17-related variable surface protein [Mycoplasma sp. 4404]|uniref:lipoprotein 17-related variable surface protein n=1 Tax=Mycoplasma sp. 4404 TaxID=3108530 RepID=UPI002B1E2E04|nr:lipoprotein 17-related variable surface protein [Mycoplasma sp. 4404]MEA4162515.1 lipoprotein 17-related variable surface protein [Mycoplasma sp. 4404]